MTTRFLVTTQNDKPAAGIVPCCAIFDPGDGTDYSPAIDPHSNLSKVKYHSAFEYLRVDRDVYSTDPGMSSVTVVSADLIDTTFTLFAHGLDYEPLIGGDIFVDGEWQAAGGQVTLFVYSSGLGRWVSTACWIGFSADETNVYMFVRGFGPPTRTVGWRIRIYAEAFDAISTADHAFYFAPGEAAFGALGKVDSEHRYVRQRPTGTGQFRFLGVPTLELDMQDTGYGAMICINSSDGAHDGSYPTLTERPLPTPHLSVAGVECDLDAEEDEGPGFELSEGVLKLRSPDGKLIFTTEYAMKAGLAMYEGSIVLAAHNPPGGAGFDSIHVVDHDIGPAPLGATRVMGFARATAGTDFAPILKAFQLAGSFVLQGRKIFRSGYTPVIADYQFISPVITGGRVVIRETYYTHGNVQEWASARTLPSLTISYVLFPVAFVGGS